MMSDEILLPRMDKMGLQCFQEKIRSSKCFLEYGCGGSTVFACNTPGVEIVISCESDEKWSNKIIGMLKDKTINVHVHHADIGEVGAWGKPKKIQGPEVNMRYIDGPWKIAQENDYRPDLVLIDGRFRVASFLSSIMYAELGSIILFDDYKDRDHYHVVEQYCPIESRYGRMAVFKLDVRSDPDELSDRIKAYACDAR